jgi:TonB family protein
VPTFTLEPQTVSTVETPYRRIATPIPVPESIPLLRRLWDTEPVAMQGQPAVVWDRAEGFSVYDRWGNRWIDWSSGVLVTNAGHGAKPIAEAIQRQAEHGLLTNYCFPSEIRLQLVEKLRSLLPKPLEKIFLLTTGSETVECAIKLCRTYGQSRRAGKSTIVSFANAFHGRTLGSQQVGGFPALKNWIGNLDPGFVQVPFPDGYRCRDTSFEAFERNLAAQGVDAASVAGVIVETYQGADAAFAPAGFMQRLRRWCDEHDALLVLDEVQAGFGRTGTMWGFEHYGVVPDVACLGKAPKATEQALFQDTQVKRVTPPAAPQQPVARQQAPKAAVATRKPQQQKTPVKREDAKPTPQTPPAPVFDSAQLSMEIASQEAELAQDIQLYAKRPKILRLNAASTRRDKGAWYKDEWRKKVERIGNLNYPDDARRKQIYGSLRLLVSINRDGTLYEVQVLESSGQRLLDQAAQRIVRLAAPYAPFTGDLADVDRLEIIRTWRFERGDRLSSN